METEYLELELIRPQSGSAGFGDKVLGIRVDSSQNESAVLKGIILTKGRLQAKSTREAETLVGLYKYGGNSAPHQPALVLLS